MLKHEKIHQKYVFFKKDEMILKLSDFRVVAFTQLAKESKKVIVTLWILSTKNLFLTA